MRRRESIWRRDLLPEPWKIPAKAVVGPLLVIGCVIWIIALAVERSALCGDWFFAVAGLLYGCQMIREAWQRRRRGRDLRAGHAGRCPRCGYDLHASRGLECPECGRYLGLKPSPPR